MPQAVIESPNDERVRIYRHLPKRKACRSRPHFVVEGRWLVHRLVDSGLAVESILCGQSQSEEFAALCPNIPLYIARTAVLKQIVGFEFHRGVLACGLRPESHDLEDVVASAGRTSLIAACSGVRDQENLGSVIRNCRAFGADALLLDSQCADAFSRRVMRVSAGAALELPVVESDDLWRDVFRLQSESGFTFVATVLDNQAIALEEFNVKDKMVVAFGSEGYGLDHEALQLSDYHVTLPMCNGIDSVNIGVASGIFLHHFSHQQRVCSR